MKIRQLCLILVAVSLQTYCPVSGQADDSDEIRPRGYGDLDRPQFKISKKNEPAEMTVNYPEDAQWFVNSMKMMLVRKHHKGSFKQTGSVWTLADETDKKTWIIKLRHTTARKKTDMRGQESLAELYPKNASVLFETSRLYEAQKNWPRALDFYRRACALPSPSRLPEALFSPAKSAAAQSRIAAKCAYYELMMGHYETAIRQLTKAIELAPLYAINYKNRAQAYRQLHKPDLAAQDEKKLLELGETKTVKDTRSLQAKSNSFGVLFYVQLGLYNQAITIADKMLKKDSQSGLGHLARARALVRLGRYEEALSDYKVLMILTKDAPSIKEEMSVAVGLAKHGPPPYGDLSLLKESPESPQRKFANNLNGKLVAVTAGRLAADHKGDYRVYSSIYKALKKRSMTKAADVELDKMLVIDPDDLKILGGKIEATEALRNWPEAEKYCTRYLNLLAGDSDRRFSMDFLKYVYTVRALARRGQKNCAGAIDDENTLVKLEPDSAEVFCDRGDCYKQWGKYEQAVADYTKAIQFDDTKTGGIYLRRAKAYEKLKKTDLARQDRDMAAKLATSAGAPKAVAD